MGLESIFQAVLEFNEAGMADLVRAELEVGAEAGEVLDQGLIKAMDEVGQRFGRGELFVPEMLMAAQAMKAGLAVIKPYLGQDEVRSAGTVVIGTVKGDLHDIGKNLVAMMMEGAGFKVVDLGVDVGADEFVAAAREHRADIAALSALLTTTMPAMEATVAAFKEQGGGVRTIIGGAPVTQAFAQKIGAAGYAQDAPSAVDLARRLLT
jgi:5-methyltetrahydrofolate--homocysteine methyltransferase